MASAPPRPDAETAERLLRALAELVAADGPAPLLAAPVAPAGAAFPERWRPTPTGVSLLLRRLAWHARIDREVVVVDDRLAAPPTERRPATRVELVGVRRGALAFNLIHIGRDDVAGTLAHELGVAHVLLAREAAQSPYRTAQADEPAAAAPPAIDDADLERGSVATVYLGLGVLAANAAYQQYSGGRWNGAYAALEYDVLRAGYLDMSELAFLLAVQAVVRAARKPVPPPGLSPPQRDEVMAWIAALRGDGADLRERLGVAAGVEPSPPRRLEPLVDPGEPEGPDKPDSARIAFRWRSHRAGTGLLVGSAVGFALAAAAPAASLVVPMGVLAATAGLGYAAGRRTQRVQCSRCLRGVSPHASSCTNCNSALRGDIARLEDRLDAEDLVSTNEPTGAS